MSSKVFSDTVSIGSLTMAERTPAPGSNNVVASGLRTSHSRWLDGHFPAHTCSSRRSGSTGRSLASPSLSSTSPASTRARSLATLRTLRSQPRDFGKSSRAAAATELARRHANKRDATDAIVDTDTTLLYGDSATVKGIYEKKRERPRTVTIEGKDFPI